MSEEFEKRVRKYLELSGWRYAFDGHAYGWMKDTFSFSPIEAFISQLREDFEKDGNIERAAELLESHRGEEASCTSTLDVPDAASH